ncbi:MAG: hypothetical protein U9Q82_01780 [Chloroflexota bacterium]|nr:hypothetical protein [Chloroflexota bacterium]
MIYNLQSYVLWSTTHKHHLLIRVTKDGFAQVDFPPRLRALGRQCPHVALCVGGATAAQRTMTALTRITRSAHRRDVPHPCQSLQHLFQQTCTHVQLAGDGGV